MFTQLFSNYLVKEKLISEADSRKYQDEIQNTRLKLGAIAINEGWLTPEQSEELNNLQTQENKRFGELAVEKGYLSQDQVEQIFKKQGLSANKYHQILCDNGFSNKDISGYLDDFRKELGFTNEELEALRNDDYDRIVQLFAPSRDEYVSKLSTIVIKNICRFITTDFYMEPMYKADELEYSMLMCQKSAGYRNIYLGIAAGDNFDGIMTMAKGFAGNVTITTSDEAYDAVCELNNVSNGLLASEMSAKSQYIDMAASEVYLNQKATGKMYVIPVYIKGNKIQIIISVADDFVAGNDKHEIKGNNKSAVEIKTDKKTAVIIDDSMLVRKILKDIMKDSAYEVIAEGTNGLEAIELYKKYNPDLITLDITMPQMDGVEALKGIIEYNKDALAIMISAAGQKEKLMEALNIGAKAFITKPFNEGEILKELDKI